MKQLLVREREHLQKRVHQAKALHVQEPLTKSRAHSVEKRLKTPAISGNGRRNEKLVGRVGQTGDVWGRNSDAEEAKRREAAVNTQNFVKRQMQANVAYG